MKLLRYGDEGRERPGVIGPDGIIRDISSKIADISPRCLSSADTVAGLMSAKIESFPAVKGKVRIGPCVGLPGKVLCAGYNSTLHTEQMGAKASASGDVTVFLKPSSAICGPNDPILYSRNTKKLDWEAELGLVIGVKGKYIDKKDAAKHILGYTCINDISDRYWQFETDDKQYTKGKGFDSFAPIGPYIVTGDDAADPSRLNVRLWVNDELRQDFSTRDYIYGAADIVSYMSKFFTLYPGDVIAMGSGPGNARSWGEDKFLKPGDRVSLEIESVGGQEQTVVVER